MPRDRITHRFSKDVDDVDNVVGEMRQLFNSTAAQVVGVIVRVTIVLPPFVAIAAGLLLVYTWTGISWEIKSNHDSTFSSGTLSLGLDSEVEENGTKTPQG
ncbi:hypothetical protein G7Z17_g665 [Cylindrodendrum hubeiense]|uniref:Uncharacterized protein n=1 Tax=Cylindrodendrum hubeiense TaxID=595255 RepID=A0A9P5LKT8_9HYPO|nr:hypothetical protein G7Z17_g665 [Cylindrodendrum hubeiense]